MFHTSIKINLDQKLQQNLNNIHARDIFHNIVPRDQRLFTFCRWMDYFLVQSTVSDRWYQWIASFRKQVFVFGSECLVQYLCVVSHLSCISWYHLWYCFYWLLFCMSDSKMYVFICFTDSNVASQKHQTQQPKSITMAISETLNRTSTETEGNQVSVWKIPVLRSIYYSGRVIR